MCIGYKHSQNIKTFKGWNKVIYSMKDTQKDNFKVFKKIFVLIISIAFFFEP